MADLLLAVRDGVRRSQLSSLVGRAIGDPETLLAWWDPARAGFVDDADRQVDIPDSGVLRVEAEGRPVAVVLAERIDLVDTGVRDSVAQALLLAAENRRLTAELRFSLEQVRESRARILAAGDETRRRIERDLHDGAQQLLISTASSSTWPRQPAMATPRWSTRSTRRRRSSTERSSSCGTWRAVSRRRAWLTVTSSPPCGSW